MYCQAVHCIPTAPGNDPHHHTVDTYTHFFIRTFYKNILDRFWEKIKNFCKITFSPKVLKWQKCDIRTSYLTLEKLRTFTQKIHEFSDVKPRFLP